MLIHICEEAYERGYQEGQDDQEPSESEIEVKRMSPETFELLEQLSVVCKRYGVNYSTAPECQRELMDCIALHEYQLNKAHHQGLTRAAVPPFLGVKRSDRSNETPA